MNKLYTLLFLLIFINSKLMYSQCQVDFGDDVYLCPQGQVYSLQPIKLIGSGPFSVTWETIQLSSNSLNNPASFFMLDTTQLPLQISSYPSPSTDQVSFVATIIDSLGATCSDTISVTFSSPGGDTLNHVYYINNGDSIQLNAPRIYPSVSSYSWFPNIDISSTSDSQVVVSPGLSTEYILTANDIDNCQVTTSHSIVIDNIPVSNQSTISKKINSIVYPNPVINQSVLSLSGDIKIKSIEVFDVMGKMVSNLDLVGANRFIIDSGLFSEGQYFYKVVFIKENKRKVETGEFIILK